MLILALNFLTYEKKVLEWWIIYKHAGDQGSAEEDGGRGSHPLQGGAHPGERGPGGKAGGHQQEAGTHGEKFSRNNGD